jgi:hypothetical protein
MRGPLGINQNIGMIRELLQVAFTALVFAAVIGVGYGIGDYHFYGGGEAGVQAGLRSLALALAAMAAPFFLIVGYAALRVRSSARQALREARALGYDAQLAGLELTIRYRLPDANRERWALSFTPAALEERPPFPRGWDLVNRSTQQLPTNLMVTLLRTANTHKGGWITYESTGDSIVVDWDLSGWNVMGGGRSRTRRVCETLKSIAETASRTSETVDA